MKEPVISVIIPVYTGTGTLRRAIDSALCQKVEIEVIVVNDCSAEDVDAVMAPYGDRVVYLKNPRNMGAAESGRLPANADRRHVLPREEPYLQEAG